MRRLGIFWPLEPSWSSWGYLIEGFSGPSGKSRRAIHHKMRDEDIIKSLKDQEAMSAGSVLCLLGYFLVGISIVWRISRYFT